MRKNRLRPLALPRLSATLSRCIALIVILLYSYAGETQTIIVTKKDSLLKDVNNNMKADPGDSLRYTTKIIVSGANATNVVLDTINFDKNLTLNPNYHIAPLARKDNYTCTGNVGINVPVGSGLLINDVDIDNNIPAGLKIVKAGSLTPDTNPGIQFNTSKGIVTINADGLGAFTYDPDAGYTGLDSFVYQLTDGDPVTPDQNGKVIITISDMIWFVDNTASTGGNGTFNSRFDALSDVSGATGPDAIGNIIYIFSGSGNYTGGIALLNSQKLIGQGTSAIPGITFAPHSNTIPINGTDPIIANNAGDGISLASGNTIRGLNIGACSDFGIEDQGGDIGALTILETDLNNTMGGGFRAANGAGTLNVEFGNFSSFSGVNGINIVNAEGTFLATSGSISFSTGTAVLINGSNVDFTYPGSITNTFNKSIDIVSRTGGTVNINGNINEMGTGINIAGNTGGTINFSGSSIIVNTGSNNAVTLNSNSGTTINFLIGGLDIDATTGMGFNATGGGTIFIAGTGNTINTTSGTALNIVNTNLGSGGVTFQSITKDGGTIGINIDNAGTAGFFTITGVGTTDGSGGTIQNTTGHGISIKNTNNITLKNMNLTSVASSNGAGSSVFGGNISVYNAGIKLTSVNNITLDNLNIDGSETAAVNGNLGQVGISGQTVSNLTILNSIVENFGNSTDEDNIQFQGLTGTVTITNLISRDSGGNLFAISNTGSGGTSPGGDLTMVVDESTFDETVNGISTSFNNLQGGLRMDVHSSGTTAITVTESTFGNGTPALMDDGLQGTGLELDVGLGHVGSLTVEDCTFTGMNVAISGSLDVDGGVAGPQLAVKIKDGSDAGSDGCTIHTIRSNAINLFTISGLSMGVGTLNATILNNIIGLAGIPNSGSQNGNAVSAINEGGSTMNVLIENNILQGVGDGGGGGEGVRIINRITASVMNATIKNNAIKDIYSNRGLEVGQLNTSGTTCSNITGNSFPGTINGDNPFNAFTSVIRVRATDGTLDIEQLVESMAPNADELDDANGISHTNISSVTSSGVINYGVSACTIPPN